MQNRPVVCRECGGRMLYKAGGMYKCEKCGNEDLDDFGRIKQFLEDNGPAPIITICRATGVERDVVDYCLKQGRIEIPNGSKYYVKCENCGTAIRYGRYCSACANELQGKLKIRQEEVGEKPREINPEMAGKMHFLKR